MNKKKRLWLPFFIFALLLNFIPIEIVGAQAVGQIGIPLISSIKKTGVAYIAQPLVQGTTQKGTEVMIYINGTYAGDAATKQGNIDVDNFTFYPSAELSAGTYKIFAIAKDPTSLRLSPPSREHEIFIASLPAPTLIQPDESIAISNSKQLITGLTISGTRVHVYVDGLYNGTIDNLVHESGTANFAYQPFLHLAVGHHDVWTVAEDGLSRISGKSNILHFKIERPFPAPTLLSLVKGNQGDSKIVITGVAKNDSLISVYVDKTLDGEFSVVNHESGTANFTYALNTALAGDKHLIFATAVAGNGKTSQWSNFINYPVKPELAPKISQVAAEEAAGAAEKPLEQTAPFFSNEQVTDLIILAKLFQSNDQVKVTGDDLADLKKLIAEKDNFILAAGDWEVLEALLAAKTQGLYVEPGSEEARAETTDGQMSEIEDLIKQSQATATGETGLIDESQESQGKLKLNLLIFIGFLLAVIVWIFWVNRELIKERREQNAESEKKSSKNDTNKLNI
ncbi:MAG: hypothetical protein U9R06_03535 [Patescibacteria group bacterium]|nr:hypothetical protein [Patescibacteria group bacterium]